MAGDGTGQYLRVSRDRHRPFVRYKPMSVPGGSNVKFVDIDLRSVGDLQLTWEALHDVPDRLGGADVVVFRWPVLVAADADEAPLREFLEAAAERPNAIGRPRAIELIAHRVGGDVLHLGRVESPAVDLRVLRALEIRSLMDDGGAVLSPDNYHFRLPSGGHASSFIRVANSFRSPRDIFVVAAWLAGRLHPNSGLVIDTPTLAPLAVQLNTMANEAGVTLGDTAILERYPRSRLDVSKAVESAADQGGAVVGVLSVDSSGVTRSLFEEALETYAPGSWSLSTLVGVGNIGRFAPTAAASTEIWTELSIQAASQGSRCDDCTSNSKAFLVRIDERTFSALPDPSPSLHVPLTDEGSNSDFWELADEVDAIQLESLPADMDNFARAERVPLSVRIDVDKLVSNPERLVQAVRRRVEQVKRNDVGSPQARAHNLYVAESLEQISKANVIFASERDLAHREALDALLAELGTDLTSVRFAGSAEALSSDAARGDRIVCFSWGSVTGGSIKRLRVMATDAYQSLEPRIVGFCVHARPPAIEEWSAVRNSFLPDRGFALWLSHIPWTSPLSEELQLLERVSVEAPTEVRDRLLYLRSPRESDGTRTNGQRALWGANDQAQGQTKVRERSLYGLLLSTDTAYAAIGAAINHARELHGSKSQRFMVNLPRISRSYFDATILASILRWTKPGEAWWGGDASEESETLISMLRYGGSTSEELAVLVPELFIASALGKAPRHVVADLIDWYEWFAHQVRPSATDDHPLRQARFALADAARDVLRLATTL